MGCENTEGLLYSAEKACKAVRELESDPTPENEVFYVIGTSIHWMVDCIERIPHDKIQPKDKKIFSGLKYANNCLKHKPTFTNAHETTGHRYPLKYPVKYEPNYIFGSLDDVQRDHRYDDQWKNYKSELEGKNISKFLTETFEIVKTYYKNP